MILLFKETNDLANIRLTTSNAKAVARSVINKRDEISSHTNGHSVETKCRSAVQQVAGSSPDSFITFRTLAVILTDDIS